MVFLEPGFLFLWLGYREMCFGLGSLNIEQQVNGLFKFMIVEKSKFSFFGIGMGRNGWYWNGPHCAPQSSWEVSNVDFVSFRVFWAPQFASPV